jgi:hypothetical protein
MDTTYHPPAGVASTGIPVSSHAAASHQPYIADAIGVTGSQVETSNAAEQASELEFTSQSGLETDGQEVFRNTNTKKPRKRTKRQKESEIKYKKNKHYAEEALKDVVKGALGGLSGTEASNVDLKILNHAEGDGEDMSLPVVMMVAVDLIRCVLSPPSQLEMI